MRLKSTDIIRRVMFVACVALLLTTCNIGQTHAQKSAPVTSPQTAEIKRQDQRAVVQQGNGGQSPGGTPAALSSKAKLKYGLRQAFFSPGAYIGPGIGAGIRQAEDWRPATKTNRDKFADYLSNYARSFGTASTTELFGSGIYPVIFRQNPVYTPLRKLSQGQASRRERLLYALGRAVIAQSDEGKMQPNYSRLAGNFTGAALTNIWERDTPRKRNQFGVVTKINHQRGTGQTFKRFGLSVGFDALSNVFEEFFKFGR